MSAEAGPAAAEQLGIRSPRVPAPEQQAPHQAQRRRIAAATLIADVLITTAAVAVGIALRSSNLLGIPDLDDGTLSLGYHLLFGGVVVLAWNLGLWFQGARRLEVMGAGGTEYRVLLLVTAQVFGVVATLAFLTHLHLARVFVVAGSTIGFTGLWAWRVLLRRWLATSAAEGALHPRVVVIDQAQSVEETTARVLSWVPSAEIVHRLTEEDRTKALDEFSSLLATEVIDFVAVGPAVMTVRNGMQEVLWRTAGRQIRVILATRLLDQNEPAVRTVRMYGHRLALLENPALDRAQRFQKRALDLVLGIPLAIIAAPIVAVLAVLVKLSDRGPGFFAQKRVGQDGELFVMWKLRTMVRNAEQLRDQLADANQADGPLFKMHDDPRVTAIGRVLRKFSLDELPQLWNVIRGEMTLVGPRPALPTEVVTYASGEHRRLLVKPGLTGLWQISGRSKKTWVESVGTDLEYIHTWSLTLDVWILLRTVPEVVFGRGE